MINDLFSKNRPHIDWRRLFTSPLVLALIVTALGIVLGLQIGRGGQSRFIDLVTIAGGAVLLWIALSRPVWGLAFTLAALPILDLVQDLLPNLPLINSLSAALGAVTLVGFIIRARWDPQANYQIRLRRQYVWAALFIVWAVATNPGAAVLDGTRNWLWTLVQLALLLFLASVLLRTERDHKIVMVCFAITATLSAAAAILDSDANTPETLGGLAAGANTAARYFLIGFIFWIYLRQTTNRPELRLLFLAAAIITLAGVVATGSRTGFLLVFIVLIFMVFVGGRAGRFRFILPILIIAAMIALLLPQQYLSLLTSTSISLQERSDTVGLRFLLWEAGWRMFSDFPIQGIGIGQFQVQLAQYGADLLPPESLSLGTHNSYMAVLSETGLVGLVLFMGLQITSLVSLWRAYRTKQSTISAIAFSWLLVLMVFMLGGLTKHDHYEKMLWIAVGVGAGMLGYLRVEVAQKPAPKTGLLNVPYQNQLGKDEKTRFVDRRQ